MCERQVEAHQTEHTDGTPLVVLTDGCDHVTCVLVRVMLERSPSPFSNLIHYNLLQDPPHMHHFPPLVEGSTALGDNGATERGEPRALPITHTIV